MPYQFCNRIFLTHDSHGYHIVQDGQQLPESDFTADQLKNPLIAEHRFINAISTFFSAKINKYIEKSDRKRGMGCLCNDNINCTECIQKRLYYDKECYLSNNLIDKMRDDGYESNCCR